MKIARNILACHQGWKPVGKLSEKTISSLDTNTSSIALSALILYLQYLGVILVDNIDFGTWGDFLDWLKIFSSLFSLQDISIDNDLMTSFVFFSIVVLSLCFFCSFLVIGCFLGFAPSTKTDIEFTVGRSRRNIVIIYIVLALIILITGFGMATVNADISFILICTGVFMFIMVLYWGIANGIFNDYFQGILEIKSILYVPVTSLLAESVVFFETGDSDFQEFGKIGIIVFAVLLAIFFVIDTLIFVGLKLELKTFDDKEKLNAIGYIINYVMIYERIAMALVGGVLGNEDFQNNSTLLENVDDEIREQLPLLGFISILSFSLLFLVGLRPFYTTVENQLEIYPRISNLVLVSFALLRNEMSGVLLQLLLFFLVSVPTFVYFIVRLNPKDIYDEFKDTLKDGQEALENFGDEVDKFEAANRNWDDDRKTTDFNKLASKFAEEGSLTKHDWFEMEIEQKVKMLLLFAVSKNNFIDNEVVNFARFFPEIITNGFYAFSNVKEIQLIPKSEEELRAIFSESTVKYFESLDSISVLITEDYYTKSTTISPIFEWVKYRDRMKTVTVVYYSLKENRDDYESIEVIGTIENLAELRIYTEYYNLFTGINGQGVLENLNPTYEFVQLYGTHISKIGESEMEVLKQIPRVCLDANKLGEADQIALMKAAADPESKIIHLSTGAQYDGAGFDYDSRPLLINETFKTIHAKPDMKFDYTHATYCGIQEDDICAWGRKVENIMSKFSFDEFTLDKLYGDTLSIDSPFTLEKGNKENIVGLEGEVWYYMSIGACYYLLPCMKYLNEKQIEQLKTFINTPGPKRDAEGRTVIQMVLEKGVSYVDEVCDLLADLGVDIEAAKKEFLS